MRFVWSGRIEELDSLFHYAPGENYSTYARSEFTPRFLEEVLANMTSSQREMAQNTCGDNKECLFDFAITGLTILFIVMSLQTVAVYVSMFSFLYIRKYVN